MTAGHFPEPHFLPKGTCQEIKNLRLDAMEVPMLTRTHCERVNTSTKDRNGPELAREIAVYLQERDVAEHKADRFMCEVAFKSDPNFEGAMKDAEAKLATSTAALKTLESWLDMERVDKETKRCKRILERHDVPIEKRRRAKDRLFWLKLTETAQKSWAMTPSEYAKKYKEEAEWLAAELKAAESKVEEFHSALVNEQAANKELKAKLEREKAIVKALLA